MTDGWILTGVGKISNYDHSVPWFDYGTAGELADLFKVRLDTNKINKDILCVSPETWGTRGIVDYEDKSASNMTGEGWVFDLLPVPVLPSGPGPVLPPGPGPDVCDLSRRGLALLHRGMQLGTADERVLKLLDYGEAYLKP